MQQLQLFQKRRHEGTNTCANHPRKHQSLWSSSIYLQLPLLEQYAEYGEFGTIARSELPLFEVRISGLNAQL